MRNALSNIGNKQEKLQNLRAAMLATTGFFNSLCAPFGASVSQA